MQVHVSINSSGCKSALFSALQFLCCVNCSNENIKTRNKGASKLRSADKHDRLLHQFCNSGSCFVGFF